MPNDEVLHVLLVEDNPSDVLLVREAMRRSPIRSDAVIAHDGVEALLHLASSEFNLVMLDLNIPKFSGHIILEKYRAGAIAPVVVFSGSDNANDRGRALALGAKEYVVKPQTFEEFMRAVQGILERWSRPCGTPGGSKEKESGGTANGSFRS